MVHLFIYVITVNNLQHYECHFNQYKTGERICDQVTFIWISMKAAYNSLKYCKSFCNQNEFNKQPGLSSDVSWHVSNRILFSY